MGLWLDGSWGLARGHRLGLGLLVGASVGSRCFSALMKHVFLVLVARSVWVASGGLHPVRLASPGVRSGARLLLTVGPCH